MTKGMIIFSVGIVGLIGTILWIVIDNLNKSKRDEQLLQKSIKNSKATNSNPERQYKKNKDNVIKDKKVEDKLKTEFINSVEDEVRTEFINHNNENYTEAIENEENKTEFIAADNQEKTEFIVSDIQEKTEFIDVNNECTQALKQYSYEQDDNGVNETESLVNVQEAQTESLISQNNKQNISELTEAIDNCTETFCSNEEKTEFL